MKLEINPNGTWYHGSNMRFEVLREGSTITQFHISRQGLVMMTMV